MKKILVALLIATGAVACAQDKPAQEPTVTTTAASTTNAVTTTSQDTTALPSTTTAPIPDQQQASTDNTATASAGVTGTASSMQPSSPDTSSAPIIDGTRSMSTKDSTGTATTKTDSGKKLTPMDQGGAKGDRDITAAIRRDVVGDKSLSFAGKNVKIITKDGRVTLRGQVKSDAEKANIEMKSRNAAGVVDVDNQLEVKP